MKSHITVLFDEGLAAEKIWSAIFAAKRLAVEIYGQELIHHDVSHIQLFVDAPD